MKKPLEVKTPELLSNTAEVSRWLGRRDSYGMIAALSSAAEVESLRRMRDEKLYRGLAPSWDVFCSKNLHASRRNIDRVIGYLKEFGPQYFHVTQMTKMTADQYRSIAAEVGPDGVRIDGGVIPLLPEHTEEVAAAVSDLLRRKEPRTAREAKKKATATAILKHCEAADKLMNDIDEDLTSEEMIALGRALLRMRQSAAGLGLEMVKL
ncbi:MAG TPA: hypothetical protein VGF59_04115 [Bryobacteraceae bacterium]|jgi:hypothetical protein